jgi:hypothetical protein
MTFQVFAGLRSNHSSRSIAALRSSPLLYPPPRARRVRGRGTTCVSAGKTLNGSNQIKRVMTVGTAELSEAIERFERAKRTL